MFEQLVLGSTFPRTASAVEAKFSRTDADILFFHDFKAEDAFIFRKQSTAVRFGTHDNVIYYSEQEEKKTNYRTTECYYDRIKEKKSSFVSFPREKKDLLWSLIQAEMPERTK